MSLCVKLHVWTRAWCFPASNLNSISWDGTVLSCFHYLQFHRNHPKNLSLKITMDSFFWQFCGTSGLKPRSSSASHNISWSNLWALLGWNSMMLYPWLGIDVGLCPEAQQSLHREHYSTASSYVLDSWRVTAPYKQKASQMRLFSREKIINALND